MAEVLTSLAALGGDGPYDGMSFGLPMRGGAPRGYFFIDRPTRERVSEETRLAAAAKRARRAERNLRELARTEE